jgi:hypothetical protein
MPVVEPLYVACVVLLSIYRFNNLVLLVALALPAPPARPDPCSPPVPHLG